VRRDGEHHESFRRAEHPGGSDRAFGLVMAAACGVFGLAPLRHGNGPRLPLLIAAAVLAGIALAAPWTLRPLNRAWTRFGMMLQRVTTPLLLGIVFFAVITPMAVVMRMRGRDPLRRRADPAARTYWIDRPPPAPAESLRRQF
jgi:hypothetical protein